MKNPASAPLSTKEVADAVTQALDALEDQGVRRWEILEAWANIAFRQGKYEASEALSHVAGVLIELD